MSRGVTTTTATELATKNFNIVNLLEFKSIGGSDVHLTDAPADITFSSSKLYKSPLYFCAKL